MQNWEVAAILRRTAELYLLKGEEEYKVKAYQRAARVVDNLPGDIGDYVEKGTLQTLAGIGDKTAALIRELVTTGRSQLVAQLESEAPGELRGLFSLPGIGFKGGAQIIRSLKPRSLAEIQQAARDGRLRALPGFGVRKEKMILQALEQRKVLPVGFTLGIAIPMAGRAASLFPEGTRFNLTGALRRGEELVRMIEFVVDSPDKDELRQRMAAGGLTGPPLETDGRLLLQTAFGLPVQIIAADGPSFPTTLLYTTGPPTHLRALEHEARQRGYSLNASGLREASGNRLSLTDEEQVYRTLGLSVVPPELRDDERSVALAREHRISRLLKSGDLRGDLHVHSDWSDGLSSIEALCHAARQRGYEYLAITDHSRSLKIANGLDVQRLEEQRRHIDALRSRFPELRILAGIEVDILRDGTLDLPDEVLRRLDLVIASIHSGFSQEEQEITARLSAAMENPFVHIIGHLTGRLLSRRDAYQADIAALLDKAAQTGTFLEINASPDRLDLSPAYQKEARAKGITMVINTDAHSTQNLDDMRYGVIAARRGGLTSGDLLNTLTWPELQARLQEKRAKK